MTTVVIENGSRVTMHYTVSLATGKLAETSRGGEPLTVILGKSDLIPGLESRLLGLAAGDQRTFEIPCAEAYGLPEPDCVYTLARTDFPPEMKLEPGLVIAFALPSSEELPGTIVEVGEGEVRVDFSHPLAGHDLVFDVEVLDVEPPHAD